MQYKHSLRAWLYQSSATDQMSDVKLSSCSTFSPKSTADAPPSIVDQRDMLTSSPSVPASAAASSPASKTAGGAWFRLAARLPQESQL
jgi:hypothetical protein